MKIKPISTLLAIILLALVACSPSNRAIQEVLSATQSTQIANTNTPEPIATFTLEPSFTPTINLTPIQTPTFTPTPTQAAITTANLDSLALVKSLGNKDSFTSFDSISLSPSGNLLAISGPINNQMTSIIYDTSNFEALSTINHLVNLAFSSDESRIAGNNIGNIEIWDIHANQPTMVIEISINDIKEMAWSSETEEIAGVDTQNTLFIWDSNTGKEIFTQQLPEPPSYSDVKLEYSPSGNFLSIVGIDAILRIWDRETIHSLPGHSDIITHSSWSPDEQFLATSSRHEANAYVWRMSNFNMVFNFANHRYWVSNIAWSPNGERIATADAEGTIKVWNAHTGGLSQSFSYLSSPEYIAWSSNGSKIAGLYGMNGSVLKVYDIETKQEYPQPENIQNANYGLLWVDESILLFNNDSRMQLWNVQLGETKMVIDPDFGEPYLSALSPDGKLMAFVERCGNVLIIEVESGEILFKVTTGIEEGIRDVAWSFDNKFVSVGSSWEKKVVVVNVAKGEINNILEHDSLNGYVNLTWSTKNNQLITGAWDGNILIWDITTSEIIQILAMHETAVLDLEISHDGSRLAAIGSRGEIYLWTTEDYERELILQGPNDGLLIASLSFSPDGDKIASSGYLFEDNSQQETRYQIWDSKTQEIIKAWNYEGLVNNIAFSPEGLLLASSTCDIWDFLTGELVFNEDCHGGSVVWTPDNKYVLFNDHFVGFWGVIP